MPSISHLPAVHIAYAKLFLGIMLLITGTCHVCSAQIVVCVCVLCAPPPKKKTWQFAFDNKSLKILTSLNCFCAYFSGNKFSVC